MHTRATMAERLTREEQWLHQPDECIVTYSQTTFALQRSLSSIIIYDLLPSAITNPISFLRIVTHFIIIKYNWIYQSHYSSSHHLSTFTVIKIEKIMDDEDGRWWIVIVVDAVVVVLVVVVITRGGGNQWWWWSWSSMHCLFSPRTVVTIAVMSNIYN